MKYPTPYLRRAELLLAALAFSLSTGVHAALTDLADTPLSSGVNAQIKPNIMYILDDSGSMDWDYMPNDAGNNDTKKCYKHYNHNRIYYNPNFTYTPPPKGDGTSFPNASFTAAKNNGYDATSGTTNLSGRGYSVHTNANTRTDTTEDNACHLDSHYTDVTLGGSATTSATIVVSGSTSASVTGIKVNGDQIMEGSTNSSATSSTVAARIENKIDNCFSDNPGNCDIRNGHRYGASVSDSTVTLTGLPQNATIVVTGGTGMTYTVTVTPPPTPSAADAAAMTNYANWYSYYRTRLLMMKAATGFAFNSMNNTYRIGFVTINPNNPVTTDKYLPISDFSATQKLNWYNKLYGQSTNGRTPLRIALSRAGRHFAGRADAINNGMGVNDGNARLTAATDPVQYSCQQNFAILTTDGYWNDETNPVRLDGTSAIGTQDSTLLVTPRPLFDGSTGSTTTITTTTTTESYTNQTCPTGQQRVNKEVVKVERNIVVTSSGTTDTSNTTTSLDPITPCAANPRALQSPNPQTVGPETSGATTAGGSNNTLADVAQYYYATDLRTNGALGATLTRADGTTYRNDVSSPNDVPKTGDGVEDDRASHQHMTTFTLGMGVPGSLAYTPEYKTAISGDFHDLRQGTKIWPAPTTDLTKSDDVWHAAVNGRGAYFSASDPNSVSSSLLSALSGVSARVGSAAAAATSNLEPVAGDNFAYVANYQTVKWDGDVEARAIDLITGTVGITPIWSAQTKLDTLVFAACDNRSIYTFTTDTAAYGNDKLKDFAWNTQKCSGTNLPTGVPLTTLTTAEQAYFNASPTGINSLTQYGAMTLLQKTAAEGANLVNFLRGWKGKEGWDGGVNIDNLYRTRDHVLGDIVNAQPIFVKKPFFSYTDIGYDAFRTGVAGNRDGMVYIAANDGMLHAIYAGSSTTDINGGVERWAYIPSMVLPNLFRLADSDYGRLHQFYVDGSPTAGDAYLGGVWKTILVGGLNKGGKGYYALDITDPGSPIALWEFKHSTTCYSAASVATQYADCHLGFTFGNPIITKLSDGTWVVIVTSGYNNVNSPTITGDGLGYLYVLNAADGRILSKITTATGSAATPSGLSKINSWVDSSATNNTAMRVYGGDLLGNVWRFDINDLLAPAGKDAFLLTVLTDNAGVRQPITTKPELASIDSIPTVYVATGSYLGEADQNTTQKQSIYAVKDTQVSTTAAPATITGLRTGTLAQQIIADTTNASGSAIRTVSCTSCSAVGGWFADFPISKERVNVDPKLQLGTLIVASNIPEGSSCSAGGYSYLNYFNYRTGSYVAGSADNAVGQKLGNSLAVGINVVRLPSGKTVVIATTSDNTQLTVEAPFETAAPSGRRSSWREILP